MWNGLLKVCQCKKYLEFSVDITNPFIKLQGKLHNVFIQFDCIKISNKIFA